MGGERLNPGQRNPPSDQQVVIVDGKPSANKYGRS